MESSSSSINGGFSQIGSVKQQTAGQDKQNPNAKAKTIESLFLITTKK
jgi:hypothetical protein